MTRQIAMYLVELFLEEKVHTKLAQKSDHERLRDRDWVAHGTKLRDFNWKTETFLVCGLLNVKDWEILIVTLDTEDIEIF